MDPTETQPHSLTVEENALTLTLSAGLAGATGATLGEAPAEIATYDIQLDIRENIGDQTGSINIDSWELNFYYGGGVGSPSTGPLLTWNTDQTWETVAAEIVKVINGTFVNTAEFTLTNDPGAHPDVTASTDTTIAGAWETITLTAKVAGTAANGIVVSFVDSNNTENFSSGVLAGGLNLRDLTQDDILHTAQGAGFTDEEQDRLLRSLFDGIHSYAIGPGIDPTGQTDSSEGLQKFIDENRGGTIYVPPGIFLIERPVVIPQLTRVIGAGRRPNVRNSAGWSSFGTHGRATHFQAGPNFPRDDESMFYTDTWFMGSETFWWHWASLEHCSISGWVIYDTPGDDTTPIVDVVPAYGFSGYQFGETSVLRDMTISRCKVANIRLCGSHAPCHLANLTINGDVTNRDTWIENPAYVPDSTNPAECEFIISEPAFTKTKGIWFTTHPTLGGNAGSVEILGLSGDQNGGSIIYSDGSCFITVHSPKFENNTGDIITFKGSSGGGAGPTLTIVGGYSQEPSGSANYFGTISTPTGPPCRAVIKIEGDGGDPEQFPQPSIELVNFRTTRPSPDVVNTWGYMPRLISNDGPAEDVPIHPHGDWAGEFGPLNGNVPFGNGRVSYGSAMDYLYTPQVWAGTQAGIIKLRKHDGTIADAIGYTTDQILRINAVSSSGVAIRNSAGHQYLRFKNEGTIEGVKIYGRSETNSGEQTLAFDSSWESRTRTYDTGHAGGGTISPSRAKRHIFNSTASADFPIPDGEFDGQEMWLTNINTGVITLTGNYNPVTLRKTDLVTGDTVILTWNATQSNWDRIAGNTGHQENNVVTETGLTVDLTHALHGNGIYLRCTNATSTTLNLQDEATALWHVGEEIEVRRGTAAGSISITLAGGVTLEGDNSASVPQGGNFRLKYLGGDAWDFITVT